MVNFQEYPDAFRTNRSLLQMQPKYRNLLTGAATKGFSLNERGMDMGQGIMETGVALMKFTAPARKASGFRWTCCCAPRSSTGAFGANTVTCKERPPRYFELDKLKAGPRPMTVSVEASWADAETFRTACGKGFARPPEAIGELVPGDAWMPDDRIKRGTVVIDLATRKVTAE